MKCNPNIPPTCSVLKRIAVSVAFVTHVKADWTILAVSVFVCTIITLVSSCRYFTVMTK